ncbi:aryl-sulfate sulfotransferase [Winogradskyella schleiferi]|uniref:aryl-sulfate sulfotransferase n=1 Tax=Winogradskyella schleiferi TaxID=2686078 RepID=UPI0015B941E6|nr:aryl-sulfate sulfotransferase [Winogradskyella schleiferi]
MKYYPIILILLVFGCEKDNPTSNPDDEPDENIIIPDSNTIGTLINSSTSWDSFTLFTPSQSSDTYLIDNCGQMINKWTSDYLSGKSVYLLEDGSILRSGEIINENIRIGGIGGAIELIDWDDNLLWSYVYSSDQYSHHHDAIPLPNGNFLLLVATRKTSEEAIENGRDPSTLTEGELYNEQIIEVTPIGQNQIEIVWEWNVWDHLIQDFDPTKANYGIISDNPQLMDINFIGRSNNKADWLHANGLAYNSMKDEIIISFQGTSELFIIDHSTTTLEAASHTGGFHNKGGDIIYRWGNPQVYDQGSSGNRTLYGQHYPHWIPDSYPDGGKIIIFNNGLDREGNYSEVNIISPPTDGFGNYLYQTGTAFLPEEAEWQYNDIGNFSSEIISSAQRLANGNTLICEGQKGRFFEISSNNRIVWEYINPDSGSGILTQGEQGLDNAVFRALKYSQDYQAFNNRELIPENPIELEPNIGNCQ